MAVETNFSGSYLMKKPRRMSLLLTHLKHDHAQFRTFFFYVFFLTYNLL